MKTVDYEWNGQTLHLLLNGAALFDAYDKFGTDAELLDIITGSSKKSFLATCWLTYKLAEQGELARRVEGFDREKIPSALRLTALMTPMDVARARRAIGRAVRIGFEMEHVEEPEVVDLGLRELQKNGTRVTRAEYLQTVTQFLGLSLSEGQRLTPGEVADLFELERIRRGLTREGE